MQDISGYGISVVVKATTTLPTGYIFTQFADDSDPFDVPSLQIADTAMGVNGDLVTWSKANPIKIAFNLIPGSLDDDVASILLEANRVGRGKIGAKDIITMVASYQSLTTLQVVRTFSLINGIITDGMPGISVASSGREKSRIYNFAFENKIGT